MGDGNHLRQCKHRIEISLVFPIRILPSLLTIFRRIRIRAGSSFSVRIRRHSIATSDGQNSQHIRGLHNFGRSLGFLMRISITAFSGWAPISENKTQLANKILGQLTKFVKLRIPRKKWEIAECFPRELSNPPHPLCPGGKRTRL